MMAVALIHGSLTADHYEEEAARDPRLDKLRSKMIVWEHAPFSHDYLDPDKRSIANTLTIHLRDGSTLGPLTIEYPLGHRRRRAEGLPLLFRKFAHNLSPHFTPKRVAEISALFQDHTALLQLSVPQLIDLFL